MHHEKNKCSLRQNFNLIRTNQITTEYISLFFGLLFLFQLFFIFIIIEFIRRIIGKGAPWEIDLNWEDDGILEDGMALIVVFSHSIDESLQLEHNVLHWEHKEHWLYVIECLHILGYNSDASKLTGYCLTLLVTRTSMKITLS